MHQCFHSDLTKVICDLFARFVRPDVLKTLTTASKLLSFNPNDQTNHLSKSKVNIGFSADQLLRDLQRLKKVSELDYHTIRTDSKGFLLELVKKLLDRSPLKQQSVLA